MSSPPVALTIAGSDPSGSSGLQADLPTFAAMGVHGTSAVTVVTAQDTTGTTRRKKRKLKGSAPERGQD